MKAKKDLKKLKGKKKFSLVGIIAFGAVFAIVGAYFVYTSFATTNYPNCYVGENYSYNNGVYTGCPNIWKGTSRHEVVKVLQKEFNAICWNNGGNGLAEDGIFDNEIKTLVTSFQRKHSLSADGSVEKGTWQKLENVYNNMKKAGTLNKCD